MKYLKRFTFDSEYTTFQNSEEYIEPHVAIITQSEAKELIYKPISIFPLYLSTTQLPNGDYAREIDDTSMTLWGWIEKNRKKDPIGVNNEDVIPYDLLQDNELYIDGVRVQYLSTDGDGTMNYWNWAPMYNYGVVDSARILPNGEIEIFLD